MVILAADTATPINTVAVCDGGRILAETVAHCGRSHAERLLDTIQWVLREAGLDLDEIEALAVSAGPGSFTGLRVGIATWKGLALGQDLPLVGVPTLTALSRRVSPLGGLLCPVLDARMDEVFAAVYRYAADGRETVLPECALPVENLAERLEGQQITLFGDGVGAYRERIAACMPNARLLDELFWTPRASAVAAEAEEMLRAGCSSEPASVRPVYLRASQAEQNRGKTAAS